MLKFGTPEPRVLDAIDDVVRRLTSTTNISTSQIMVVGAHARDIINSGLQNETAMRSTQDIDLALALSNWDAYRPITESYQRLGNSDIRYRVAEWPVDFMPFGEAVENPPGAITPPPRNEPWTVEGFRDVYQHAQPVELSAGTVYVPSPAGYAALKMRSWADRSPTHVTKDAPDLALACQWYTDSSEIQEQLWEDAELTQGTSILEN